MPFSKDEVSKLLVACKRRCCICHRFCGIKIETDHIIPKSEGGSDAIENAITLCFECHTEVHLYNNKHPRGRKYTSKELKMHKEKWIEICQKSPELFIDAPRFTDGGALSGLIAELEFNYRISRLFNCPFETHQFQNAISDGILSLLDEELRDMIMDTYARLNLANRMIAKLERMSESSVEYKYTRPSVQNQCNEAGKIISDNLDKLRTFVASKDT